MATGWAPELRVHEVGDGCRLTLVGLTYGSGATLQEAADDLIDRLLHIALTYDAPRRPRSRALGAPDPRIVEFVRDVGEIARGGGDIRKRVFGGTPTRDDTTA